MSHGFIGYGRQSIADSDIEAVNRVLRGDFLTQGPLVEAFEAALAEYVGAKYAVAVSSGTAALHVACLAAGAAPGKLGVTQPITFVASANCMAYCGADVDLVEIDPATLTMNPDSLAAYLQDNPRCEYIVPVSMSGLSTHGSELREVAGDRIIIEDASHSLGAQMPDGQKVGSGRWADMTVFSFHPVKPITTAEGGAVVTNDATLAHRMRIMRTHGIEREPDLLQAPEQNEGLWYYEQQHLGFNYRLTDVQCALGLSQLGRIDAFIKRRREIALAYDRLLGNTPYLRPLLSDPEQRARCGHHLYLVSIDFDAAGISRGELMQRLRGNGIGTQVHYIPVYRQPYWRARIAGGAQRFPHSEAYYRTCLTLPCFPEMTEDDITRVVSALQGILAR